MKSLSSIRWRLQLWYALLLVGVLAGFGVMAYRLESARLMQQVDDGLESLLPVLVASQHPARDDRTLRVLTVSARDAALFDRLQPILHQILHGENLSDAIGRKLADFRQAGADLPEERRQRLEVIQGELAQLTQKYSENVLDATNAWKVVVTDPLPTKRSLALELGADEVFDATDPGVAAAVRASLGTSADIVFDCVAVQATMDQAIAMAIKGGTVVVVGVPSRPVTVPLPEIQDLQIRIQGSATYVRSDIETAIGMLAAHAVPADRIVTAAYPLSRAGEAFAAASDGSNVKVIVRAEG